MENLDRRIAASLARRVAVVGAGFAGMAAAVTLADAGVPVSVFEAAAVVGGRARRIVSHGETLDNGQHILVGAYTELYRLMQRVGVPSDALLRIPLELNYAAQFRFRALGLPPPFALLGGLLLARGIPLQERLGAVRFMRQLKRIGFQLRADITVEELLAAHGQDGAIGRYLWGPLCVAALNTPLRIASANVFLAVLRDTLADHREASDLLFPRVDLSRLFPEPAAHFIRTRGGELRLRSPVRELGELEKFAATIVAVGPHQLNALLPEAAPAYTYQPIYTCYLQYAESVRLPFPMLGLGGGLVQWAFDRGALTGERGRLACVISAQGEHQEMTLDAICDACSREIARAFPRLGTPLWSRAVAEKRATITCVPNVERPNIVTARRGVYLAGDYTDPVYPPTLEAAVRSGVRAARVALNQFAA